MRRTNTRDVKKALKQRKRERKRAERRNLMLSDTGLFLIVAGLLLSGTAGAIAGICHAMDKAELKKEYTLKEHTILGKIHYEKGRDTTNYYQFIVDENEDGIFDVNEDAIVRANEFSYQLSQEKDKAVYIEDSDKHSRVIAIKNKDGKYHKISNIEDIYGTKSTQKNQSLNKITQEFNEKYQKQR